jgi:hypothetical protein
MKIFYQNLNFNSNLKKFQNFRNKCVQHVGQMDRDRHTATLNSEISAIWDFVMFMDPCIIIYFFLGITKKM